MKYKLVNGWEIGKRINTVRISKEEVIEMYKDLKKRKDISGFLFGLEVLK